ncbi:MAG: HAMP domain-containing histidine kinase [Oscillospiraceae bacterium]|nr:HAMP domain-containing histidine kinase [Oscillospiraceae bacterium]
MKQKKRRIGLRLYFFLFVMLELIGTVALAVLIVALIDFSFDGGLTSWVFLLVLLFSAAIGAAATGILSFVFFGPITRLSRAMRSVAAGNIDTRIEEKSRIREMQELYENFNLMTRELSATEILQTDFVANVSHEFKTPINAIEGYAMLLQGSAGVTDEQETYVERILFNTRRISTLVGNILLLSKLENKAIGPQTTRFRLDEQVRQSILLLEPKWTQRRVDFDVDMEELEFTGYESLLAHVWTNLLSNAIKFGPEDGLVRVRLRRCDTGVVFTVEDEGSGIPDAARQHIFDKFYQSDSSHREEGNGLGLTLVRRIVDASGGSVTAENLAPRGCRFTVLLPIVNKC